MILYMMVGTLKWCSRISSFTVDAPDEYDYDDDDKRNKKK